MFFSLERKEPKVSRLKTAGTGKTENKLLKFSYIMLQKFNSPRQKAVGVQTEIFA